MPLFPLQVVKILEKHEPGRSSSSALSFLSGHSKSDNSSSGALRLGPIPADEASAVQNYVEHMLFLLMEEEAGQGERTKSQNETFTAFVLTPVTLCPQVEPWAPSWSSWS